MHIYVCKGQICFKYIFMHVRNNLCTTYFWKKNKSHKPHILTILVILMTNLLVIILYSTKIVIWMVV
jgi:hypothetical protein